MERKFKRKLESLEAVFAAVERFFAEQNLDTSLLFSTHLAVEELFTNFVKHNPRGRGEITLRLRLDGARLIVQLIDPDAAPLDVTQIPPPDVQAPLEERQVGGLGLHLVRKMVDGLEYEHEKGRTTITFTKQVERKHV